MKKYIPCKACNRNCLIANVTLYQTHWYVQPHGCTGGDYWNEGECQFICHHCKAVNRLLSKQKNDVFQRQYKKAFKEVVDTHDDNALIPKFDIVAMTLYMQKHGKLPDQNWVNNYWIDSLEA